MTPAAIIREAQADGVRLSLSLAGTIKATGEGAAVNRWLAVIREHKAKIIDVLKVGASDTVTASRWWLIHYPDRDPVEVACYPEATHADILERHPDAVAADLIPAKPAPVSDCKTCQHRPPGRQSHEPAPCGEPVVAGLSDRDGVIRYSPDNGKTCKAWLARLDTDLERRILTMAERWHYSGDELAMALEGARSDPDGWRRVVDSDERGQ